MAIAPMRLDEQVVEQNIVHYLTSEMLLFLL